MTAALNCSDLVRKDAVHGNAYRDPDVFNAELERILADGWVYIGHASEVPTVGDFTNSALGIQPVIMCRDESGDVQVFFNRCRHRAASVCQVDRGQTKSFRCEYHGWTYAFDGRLTQVPYDVSRLMRESSVVWCGSFAGISLAPARQAK